jgi:hypothetical protein
MNLPAKNQFAQRSSKKHLHPQPIAHQTKKENLYSKVKEVPPPPKKKKRKTVR